MVRLYLFAEGYTEQTFADTVLGPHLAQHEVYMHNSLMISTGENTRGGGQIYNRMKKGILKLLKQDRQFDAFFTTMIDLYGIHPDFPGLSESKQLRQEPIKQVEFLEQKFKEDISDPRFIPYIQLHEYEALLFTDLSHFGSQFPNNNPKEISKKIESLKAIAAQYQIPELINDGVETAPSKRIISHFPEYKKASDGPLLAELIGLQLIRKKCPHFNKWLSQIESLK